MTTEKNQIDSALSNFLTKIPDFTKPIGGIKHDYSSYCNCQDCHPGNQSKIRAATRYIVVQMELTMSLTEAINLFAGLNYQWDEENYVFIFTKDSFKADTLIRTQEELTNSDLAEFISHYDELRVSIKVNWNDFNHLRDDFPEKVPF
ncbi:hypothetical protein [Sulfurimonas sp.]|uniref:hypothetical protein n=1 Tax=Sulfurimonas sp. TaxID=2022749 RepID=UPI003D0F66F1